MAGDVISRYVTDRIQDNHQWYAKKQVLAAECTLRLPDFELYHIVQDALLFQLNQGHTILHINDHDDLNDRHGLNGVIPIWQQKIMDSCLTVITHALADEGMDWAAFFDDYHRCADDTIKIKQFVNHALNHFRQQLSLLDHTVMEIEQLAALFLSMLRIYYVLYKNANTLNQFVSLLHNNTFFGDILAPNIQSIPTNTPPIYFSDQADGLYLWTSRAYLAESQLMTHILRISQADVPVFALDQLPSSLNTEQRDAIKLVSKQAFCLITGGPGTGKTFTVAQIVIALNQRDEHKKMRLGLAAPTGKAAQRMSESLLKSLDKENDIQLPEPKTIHRLLGIGANGSPRYDAKNQLPLDMLIIDEASMLGTELASQLFAAIATGCRVILLGDTHQLAAVDAGAVLADLCRIERLRHLRVNLTASKRFTDTSGVGQLARLINDDRQNIHFDEIQQLINYHTNIDFHPITHALMHNDTYQKLSQDYQDYFLASKRLRFSFAKLSGQDAIDSVKNLFEILDTYRILCASHLGVFGDDQINDYLSLAHRAVQKIPPSASPWFHGRVVMVTKNLYDLGLFNGDIGICLWGSSGLSVYFEGETLRMVAVDMLSDTVVSTAYAITVHKSQGSEWQKVAIIFDDNSERLLSKELIYTAVTRAKSAVHIYSTHDALINAINTPTVRQTGLDKVSDDRQS